MKRKAILLALLGACGSFAASQAAEPNVPIIKVKAETPLQLPEGMHFGEVPGVAVNKKGHVFVYTRSDISGPAYGARAGQILEFDQTGKFVREIGRNLYAWGYAHQLRVDKDDFLWAVDKGTNTVVKFDDNGHVIDVYGRPEESTEWRSLPPRNEKPNTKAPEHKMGEFDNQTDIAWDSKGNFYITDGYGNSRVVKFSKDGNWIKGWGERGTGPGQFATPHQLVIDNRDNIYVSDRGNARIQVFNTDGKFLRQFSIQNQIPLPPNFKPRGDDPTVKKAYPDAPPQLLSVAPGAGNGMCITPGPDQVLYISDIGPSRIYKVSLDGKVLGMFGGRGIKVGEFNTTHELSCPDNKTIWAADMFNWRVQKVTILE